jgi:hypothetical protein
VSLIGPPFGVPGMRPLGVPSLPTLEDQRRLVVTARRRARRWMLRSVLLLVIGALAMRNGWVVFGVVFLALAILAIQLARSTTRSAAELADRLKELESR